MRDEHWHAGMLQDIAHETPRGITRRQRAKIDEAPGIYILQR